MKEDINEKNKKKNSKYNYAPPIEGFDYSQTIDMKVDEVLSRLPKYTLKDIKYFISRGVIRKFPITALDYEVLKRIHIIWRNYQTVVLMISKMKRKLRQRALQHSDIRLDSKLEAWMYSRLSNLISRSKRIPRNRIVDEAIRLFRLKNDARKRKELLKTLDKLVKKWKLRNEKSRKDKKRVEKEEKI